MFLSDRYNAIKPYNCQKFIIGAYNRILWCFVKTSKEFASNCISCEYQKNTNRIGTKLHSLDSGRTHD